jgi:hypothetical protein
VKEGLRFELVDGGRNWCNCKDESVDYVVHKLWAGFSIV